MVPKSAAHTQTLERLNVSSQCQERASFEVSQKNVETPPVQLKKTVLDNQKSTSNPTSIIHTFKSNTSSSQRTRAIKNMMDVVHLKADAERRMQHANVTLKNLTATEQNRANRSIKKLLKIRDLPEVDTCVHNQVPIGNLRKESISYPNIGVPNNNDSH